MSRCTNESVLIRIDPVVVCLGVWPLTVSAQCPTFVSTLATELMNYRPYMLIENIKPKSAIDLTQTDLLMKQLAKSCGITRT